MKAKAAEPMFYAAGYTLDLYCDHTNEDHPYTQSFPSYMREYYAQTFAQAAAQAREAGWVIHRDRTATCPMCSGKKKKNTTTT